VSRTIGARRSRRHQVTAKASGLSTPSTPIGERPLRLSSNCRLGGLDGVASCPPSHLPDLVCCLTAGSRPPTTIAPAVYLGQRRAECEQPSRATLHRRTRTGLAPCVSLSFTPHHCLAAGAAFSAVQPAQHPVLCRWAATEFGPMACGKFFYFSEYIQILVSSKYLYRFELSQKNLK
jgi:hypothetical protein